MVAQIEWNEDEGGFECGIFALLSRLTQQNHLPGGFSRWCQKLQQPFQIEGGTHQGPFVRNRRCPSLEKPSEPHGLLDYAEHRLYRTTACGDQFPASRCSQFFDPLELECPRSLPLPALIVFCGDSMRILNRDNCMDSMLDLQFMDLMVVVIPGISHHGMHRSATILLTFLGHHQQLV